MILEYFAKGNSVQDQLSEAQSGTGTGGNLQVTVSSVLNVVFGVIAIVAVIFIIVGGVNYATSQGDAAKIKKGRDAIIAGVVGLIISLLAFAIVNFVLKAMLGEF